MYVRILQLPSGHEGAVAHLGVVAHLESFIKFELASVRLDEQHQWHGVGIIRGPGGISVADVELGSPSDQCYKPFSSVDLSMEVEEYR